MSIADLVNAHVRDLEPYEPGKPIEEIERELGLQGSVKLGLNENALGPSPRAVAALHAAVDGVHRYPDGHGLALRRKLAQRLAVPEAGLVLGNGSDEILELLAKTFLSPGDEVVYAWPSFAMYPIVVKGMGATPVAVPLDADHVHDLEGLAAAITERTKIVFVCNPNNPTGTSVGAEAFDRFAASLPENVVLVVDEAYVEYVRRDDFPDALAWVERRPATIVLRTLSKIYGLAGLRVGYGVTTPEFASYLERSRHPFSLNAMAQAAAVAAIDDEEHVARSREMNARGMAYLETELGALDIEVTPSDSNFLLARTGAGVDAALVHEGVFVRGMAGFGLPEHVRVTVGLPEENERLVKALRRLREGA